MGLFSWLFGSRRSESRAHAHTDDDWLTRRSTQPDRKPPHDECPKPAQIAQPVRQPVLPQAPALPAGTILIDYTNASGTRRTRRIRPLLGSPNDMLTAIDIDARRVRTYRIDRVHSAIAGPNAEPIEIRQYLAENHQIHGQDFANAFDPRSSALDMIRRMVSQISIMRLVAEADGPMDDREITALLKYIKRDNRFAVRSDFVEVGDKRNVWPIALQLAQAIEIETGDLTVFLGTVFDDWENPRRFAAMGDSLTEMANLAQPIHPKVKAMIDTINGYRQ